MIQGLLVLNKPDYVFERWHGTLLVLLLMVVALLFNTFLARRLPLLEVIFVFVHVFGAAIFIPVLALASKRQAGSPLVDFFNGGGWSSNGLATLVGSSGPIGALIGFDCNIHMGPSVCRLEPASNSRSRGDQRFLPCCASHPSCCLYRQRSLGIFRLDDVVSSILLHFT